MNKMWLHFCQTHYDHAVITLYLKQKITQETFLKKSFNIPCMCWKQHTSPFTKTI